MNKEMQNSPQGLSSQRNSCIICSGHERPPLRGNT